MINKNQIGPWNDNYSHDFQIELKQTFLEQKLAINKENKLVELSKRFASEGKIQTIKTSKILPFYENFTNHNSISLKKSPQFQVFSSQKSYSRIRKGLSCRLSTLQNDKQAKQISLKIKKPFDHLISSNQKISGPSKLKKPYFQANSNHQQNLPYFFQLSQKQKIRWQPNKRSQQQHFDRTQIFKKVYEISPKKKNQIKLPKISVAYSLPRILQ